MTTSDPAACQTVELRPNYRFSMILLIMALPVLYLQVWLGLAGLGFAVFLFFQTATLRLHFTASALDIYRGEKLIRQFPYADWQNWRIFWTAVPILFYFKEVKSIHFLPILFDPQTLQATLETHCPRMEKKSL
ncbi:MAG TPA: DUF3119 family protein [Candidatus Caenarcaniphilales bacterium]